MDEPITTSRSGTQPNNWYGVNFTLDGFVFLFMREAYEVISLCAK
jgi:hypothetical protein